MSARTRLPASASPARPARATGRATPAPGAGPEGKQGDRDRRHHQHRDHRELRYRGHDLLQMGRENARIALSSAERMVAIAERAVAGLGLRPPPGHRTS